MIKKHNAKHLKKDRQRINNIQQLDIQQDDGNSACREKKGMDRIFTEKW